MIYLHEPELNFLYRINDLDYEMYSPKQQKWIQAQEDEDIFLYRSGVDEISEEDANKLIEEYNSKFKAEDAIISNENDPLYKLQKKYGVKISRSNSSDAVYIFKNRKKYMVRIGHPIDRGQKHLQNFSENVVSSHPNVELVERVIRNNLSKF